MPHVGQPLCILVKGGHSSTARSTLRRILAICRMSPSRCLLPRVRACVAHALVWAMVLIPVDALTCQLPMRIYTC